MTAKDKKCVRSGCSDTGTMAVRTRAPEGKSLTTQFWQDEADAPSTADRYCGQHAVELVFGLAKTYAR